MSQRRARRRFGAVEKLKSGRWRASYIDDGDRSYAPQTFRTKTDADRWLAQQELDLTSGRPIQSAASGVEFGDYARAWLDRHASLGPRWRETCERNMRLHMGPLVGLRLRAISATTVGDWYADAIAAGGGKTSVAQSYRFARAVLNAAVREGLIERNPCQLPGAGTPRVAPRPIATVEEVERLADAIVPRYKAAVLLAAWGALRRGEILALHRRDVDLDAGTVRVELTQTELLSRRQRFDSKPKTDAGYRTVAVPAPVVDALRDHLKLFAGQNRVFVAADGGPMRGDTLYQAFARARSKVGVEQLHFHDLRHTGQTLAAATGATLADLMKRLGHSSPAAALRYLHTVEGRDRAIADALTDLALSRDPARLPRKLGGR